MSEFAVLELLELRDFPEDRTFTRTLQSIALLKYLKKLSLNNFYVESEESLRRAVDGLKGLKSLTDIGPSHGTVLTDRFCQFIAEKLPQISEVDFSRNDLITDAGIQIIMDQMNLQVPKLVKCLGITGLSLTGQNELKELDLTDCVNVNGGLLMKLVKQHHWLELLNLTGCCRDLSLSMSNTVAIVDGYVAAEKRIESIVCAADETFKKILMRVRDILKY